nr:lysophosphatidylcholine acyltransferase 1 isoform X3 [Pongo pygmaeus]
MRLRGCGPRAAPASSAGASDARLLAPPGRNPFVHELRLSALQKAQVALMTLTLFPVRLLVAAAMMLLAWPLALVASLGSVEKEPEQPLALWRKVVDFLLKAIMRTMWFAGGFHRVAVKGRQALPTEAAILTLAPHSSYFDAIPVTMTMSSIVMKAESRDIPIWGTLIRYIRPVFVSRSDQDSRRKTVEEIKRRAQSNGKWPQIMIFPEGTCTNRTCLITFKPGAFIPGAPVQPVVLRYPNKLDTITWTWQGPGALEILWLTLCQFHNQVEIEFLPVYSPSEEEKRNPALYASNVRRVMAEALGVSVTDYTFEDCQLALAEGQLRLPADTCLLEFARLVRGLGLKPEKLEKDLDRYSERARMNRGEKIGIAEFAASLEVPVSDLLEDMFSLFDESGSGEVDLRECVVALSVVCRPARTLDTIQLAFKTVDW